MDPYRRVVKDGAYKVLEELGGRQIAGGVLDRVEGVCLVVPVQGEEHGCVEKAVGFAQPDELISEVLEGPCFIEDVSPNEVGEPHGRERVPISEILSLPDGLL